MPATEYDISGYQPVLFSARSLDEVTDTLGGFLSGARRGERPALRTDRRVLRAGPRQDRVTDSRR